MAFANSVFPTCVFKSTLKCANTGSITSFSDKDLNISISLSRVSAKSSTDLTNNLSPELNLSKKGFNVTHLKDTHDYPAYNGSYTRSYNTVSSALNSHSSTQLVIDLHRDAVGSKSDYAPSVMIGDEKVAQLMFVIGTNGGGMSHDNWNTNLKFAIKIQQKANEMYPGLFRPIVVRNSRYNQNLADGACIIEVGATGNTLEESIGSMKYLSNVLEVTMKE